MALHGLIRKGRIEVDRMVEVQSIPPRTREPTAVFVHYLNPDILSLYGFKVESTKVRQAGYELTRYALILASARVIFPISLLFEVSWLPRLMSKLAPALDMGQVQVCSPLGDAEGYINKKRSEFPEQQSLHPGYESAQLARRVNDELQGSWLPRIATSAASFITEAWRAELNVEGGLWDQVLRDLRSAGRSLPESPERAIERLPERLQGRAFLMMNVRPRLPFEWTGRAETNVQMFLARRYIESFLKEFDACILVGGKLGELDCGIARSRNFWDPRALSFIAAKQALEFLHLDAALGGLSWEDLAKLLQTEAYQALQPTLVRAARKIERTSSVFQKRPKRIRSRGPIANFEEVLGHVEYLAEHVSGRSLEPQADDQTRRVLDDSVSYVTSEPRSKTMQTKTQTILFMDVSGWSKLRPADIATFVEKAMPKLAEIVNRHSAELVNTWGDALVATFNSVTAACECALDIRDTFRRGTPQQGFAEGLRSRISLHMGEVIYTRNPIIERNDIFGPAVHLAARLEPKTQPGAVFCTEAVANALQEISGLGPKAAFVEEVELPKGFGKCKAFRVLGQGED